MPTGSFDGKGIEKYLMVQPADLYETDFGATGGNMSSNEKHVEPLEKELPKETKIDLWFLIVGASLIFFGIVTLICSSLYFHAIQDLDCAGTRAMSGIFLLLSIFMIGLGGVLVGLKGIRRVAAAEPTVDGANTTASETPPAEGGSIVHLILKIVVSVVLVLFYVGCIIVCAIGGAFYRMSLQEPDYSMSLSGAGSLSNPVHITRDANGIPHIEGSTAEDVVFGQGFVHAQDRLMQLELTRLAAHGKLAKYLGSTLVKTDKALRVLGFSRSGRESCVALDATSRALLQAYTSGVNFYLDHVHERPPEFMFFERILQFHEPEKFTLDDFCAMFRVLQFSVSSNLDHESVRWKLWADGLFSFDVIDDLYSDATNTTSIMSAAELGLSELDAITARARETEDKRLEKNLYDGAMGKFRNNASATNKASGHGFISQEIHNSGADSSESGSSWINAFRSLSGIRSLFHRPGGGSNAWQARAPNGAAVGVSDPHLQSTQPSIWHNAHLTIGGTSFAAGVTVVGLPGFLIGRTEHVSLGITLAITDNSDLFVMEPDPSRPSSHYMLNGVSTAYNVTREVIEISDGTSESFDVYTSVYGPDIAESWELSTIHRLCLWSEAIRSDTQSLNAISRIWLPNATKTVSELTTNLLNVQSPPLSIAMGDSQGTVGWMMTGRHPWRVLGHTGRYPTMGNGSYSYRGELSPHLNPRKLDNNTSQAAFVQCANQKVYADGFPYSMSYDWSSPLRGTYIQKRLSEALATNSSVLSDVAWHQSLQTNATSTVWQHVIGPRLHQADLWGKEFLSYLNQDGQRMLQTLQGWNNISSVGSKAAAQFNEWFVELSRLPSDVLAVLGWHSWAPKFYSLRILFDVSPGILQRCRSTPRANNCTYYAAQVWNKVAKDRSLVWGKNRNMLRVRSTFADGTVLQCMFNYGGAKDGDRSSINVADIPEEKLNSKLEVTQVSSMRQVYDMGAHDRYWFTFAAGNSGNPWSKWYANFLQTFLEDRYVEIKLAKGSGVKQSLSP